MISSYILAIFSGGNSELQTGILWTGSGAIGPLSQTRNL